MRSNKVAVLHCVNGERLLEAVRPSLQKDEDWLSNTHGLLGTQTLPFTKLFDWSKLSDDPESLLSELDSSIRWQRIALTASLIYRSLQTAKETCRLTSTDLKLSEAQREKRIQESAVLIKRVASQLRRERSTLMHHKTYPTLAKPMYTNHVNKAFTLNGTKNTLPEIINGKFDARRFVSEVDDFMWERIDGQDIIDVASIDSSAELTTPPELSAQYSEAHKLRLTMKRLADLKLKDVQDGRDHSDFKGSISMVLIPMDIALPRGMQEVFKYEPTRGLSDEHRIPMAGILVDGSGRIVSRHALLSSTDNGQFPSNACIFVTNRQSELIAQLLHEQPNKIDLCSTSLIV